MFICFSLSLFLFLTFFISLTRRILSLLLNFVLSLNAGGKLSSFHRCAHLFDPQTQTHKKKWRFLTEMFIFSAPPSSRPFFYFLPFHKFTTHPLPTIFPCCKLNHAYINCSTNLLDNCYHTHILYCSHYILSLLSLEIIIVSQRYYFHYGFPFISLFFSFLSFFLSNKKIPSF